MTINQDSVNACDRYLAGVTQLVESLPSKQVVAGSSPVSRSNDEV